MPKFFFFTNAYCHAINAFYSFSYIFILYFKIHRLNWWLTAWQNYWTPRFIKKQTLKLFFFLSHFFLFTAQQQKVDFFSSANEKIAALNEISVKTKFSIFQAPRRSENEKCGQCGRMYVAMRWCWVFWGLNVKCFMLNVIWIHRKFQDVFAETLKLFLQKSWAVRSKNFKMKTQQKS